ALPEGLLESELFGHVRGAFTGADRDREGLFEAARGGTLFLDEIGEIPLPMQVKLLRVLQEREVRRVGESESRPVDVRIVAATHRNLEREVDAGRFREDLFYRLRVVSIDLPPLRSRPEDILPLARVLLDKLRTRFGQDEARLGNPACQALLAHAWPGNVRELENAMERALVMTDTGIIRPEDLGLSRSVAMNESVPEASGEGADLGSLAAVERSHIERVLRAHGGHRRRAAEALGIGEATLYRKLKSWK
ncbi:MAG: sigma 54-interacting transcriptional regulator, partial [Myxococcota bacterium]